MIDGTGSTLYSYHPAGQVGAGQLASVDGPLSNDTISYTYDALGRATNRSVGGVAATWIFGPLGRMTSETNALGTFGYSYDGATPRLGRVSYPNGQTSTY